MSADYGLRAKTIEMADSTLYVTLDDALEALAAAKAENAPKIIGILAHDNGEYDAYVGYFDNPERLKRAVQKLSEERRDLDDGEPVQAEVMVQRITPVPEHIDDAFLDLLGGCLSEAGYEIERADEAKERRDEMERERLEEIEESQRPVVPSPGQEEIGL